MTATEGIGMAQVSGAPVCAHDYTTFRNQAGFEMHPNGKACPSGRWQPEEGLDLSELMGRAIGAASTCWFGGTGFLEFDSTRAQQITKALEFEVRQTVKEATRIADSRANLGLATTRDLLLEIRARGDLMLAARPYTEDSADGAVLTGIANAALRSISETMLNYRTVDSD